MVLGLADRTGPSRIAALAGERTRDRETVPGQSIVQIRTTQVKRWSKTVISGPMNDSPRRPHEESAEARSGYFVGRSAVGGRSLPADGSTSCPEPSKVLAAPKGPPCQAVRVERRGSSIRLACGCGNFVLSFHSLCVIRHGRFRCPICGREVRLSELEALRGIRRISRGKEAWTSPSKLAPPD